MGKGDKKSKKGKRWRKSYGNSLNRKKIKAQIKRAARKKKSPAAGEAKTKTRKTTKKKDE